jgi:hypothetical protein
MVRTLVSAVVVRAESMVLVLTALVRMEVLLVDLVTAEPLVETVALAQVETVALALAAMVAAAAARST